MNGGKTKDHYKTLGVGKNASQKDIKNAYRKLARKYHPDSNQKNKAAEERFKEVTEAYETVSDPEKRKEYDQQVEYFASGGPRRGPGGPGGSHDYFTSDVDFGSVFGDIFGAGAKTQEPIKGDDLHYTLTLGLKEVIQGTTKKIKYARRKACTTCGGTGAKAGTSQSACPTCGGRGVIAQNQGFFSLSRACPTCGGEGVTVKDHCSKCGGSGTMPDDKVVTAKIPAGINDGGKLKFRGHGQAGHRGAPAGDLYIIVQVRKHPLFTRKGNNIHMNLPLKFTEAALGATVKVPTIDGSVSLKIPAGTQSGQTLRIKGRGVPKTRGVGSGDLMVTVQVQIPSKLSPEQRELLARLADQSKENPREKLEKLAASS